MLTGI